MCNECTAAGRLSLVKLPNTVKTSRLCNNRCSFKIYTKYPVQQPKNINEYRATPEKLLFWSPNLFQLAPGHRRPHACTGDWRAISSVCHRCAHDGGCLCPGHDRSIRRSKERPPQGIHQRLLSKRAGGADCRIQLGPYDYPVHWCGPDLLLLRHAQCIWPTLGANCIDWVICYDFECAYPNPWQHHFS